MSVLKTCSVSKHFKICGATWSSSTNTTYTMMNFVLQYAVPSVVMSLTYFFIIYDVNKKREYDTTHQQVQRENKKLTKLSIVLTVTFMVCGLPFQIVGFMFDMFEHAHVHHGVIVVCYMFLLVNSALNPILYNLFSSNFRQSLREFVQKQLCGRGHKQPSDIPMLVKSRRSDTNKQLLVTISRC